VECLPTCRSNSGLHQSSIPSRPRTDANERLGRAFPIHGGAKSLRKVRNSFLHLRIVEAKDISSPILYRTFYLLTPPSELPKLPTSIKGYLGVHIYTVVQIIATVMIFIVTLTKGAPAFPVIIIALVPIRLLLMNKLWNREILKFVDAWACREGTPEDDEDLLHGNEKHSGSQDASPAPQESLMPA